MGKSLSKIVGKNIKIILKQKHITQEKAACLLNVSDRTMRRWLKDGINKISIIAHICEVFEIDDITTLLIDHE